MFRFLFLRASGGVAASSIQFKIMICDAIWFLAGSALTLARARARARDLKRKGMDAHDSTAFFFVKPHAVNDKVSAFAARTLKGKGIRVVDSGELSGSDMKNIIDRHYGTLAERAMSVKPSALPPIPEKALAAFQEKFGEEWRDAVANGRVKNLADAVSSGVFGTGASAAEIETQWRAGPYAKLFPGTYVACVNNVYVINGFYLSMREKFVSAPRGVRWMVLSWNSAQLSWDAFRTQVVGATNPQAADPGSLRGLLLADFAQYGLSAEPSGADNGFHASASPLEAIHERSIWLCGGGMPKDDPLRAELASRGFSGDQILHYLATNPSFECDAGKPLFDVVEHTDTAVAAELIAARLGADASNRMN